MAQWHGHTVTTSASLLAILLDARAGGTCFSYAERVLCTACEFWAAAMNRTLTNHLGEKAGAVLRDADEAFAAIGVASVVNLLRESQSLLSATAQPPRTARQVATDLQRGLYHLEEPVDDLIGQYAAEQTWSRLKRPDFSAMLPSTADDKFATSDEHRSR